MYVNVFANIVDAEDIEEADRELASNLVCLFVNLGIVLSSIFEVIAAYSFLKDNTNPGGGGGGGGGGGNSSSILVTSNNSSSSGGGGSCFGLHI